MGDKKTTLVSTLTLFVSFLLTSLHFPGKKMQMGDLQRDQATKGFISIFERKSQNKEK